MPVTLTQLKCNLGKHVKVCGVTCALAIKIVGGHKKGAV